MLQAVPSMKSASLLTHSLLGCRMRGMAVKKMQVRVSPLRLVSLKQKQVCFKLCHGMERNLKKPYPLLGQVLGFQPKQTHELAQPFLSLQGQSGDAPEPEPGMHALMRQNSPGQQVGEAVQHQDGCHLHQASATQDILGMDTTLGLLSPVPRKRY